MGFEPTTTSLGSGFDPSTPGHNTTQQYISRPKPIKRFCSFLWLWRCIEAVPYNRDLNRNFCIGNRDCRNRAPDGGADICLI